MDGTIKRSDGSDSEPIPPGDPTSAAAEQPGVACTSSWECRAPPRDRSYCSADKTCVGGVSRTIIAGIWVAFFQGCQQ